MRGPEVLYYVINLLPLPIWFAWIAMPGSRAYRYFASALWPWAALCVVYVALIGTAMFIIRGPEGADMLSLDGVKLIFDSDWATLGGWAHYLCFDAFVARWIVNDIERPSYKYSPILLFTLMFGPFGLGLYLLARDRARSVTPRA